MQCEYVSLYAYLTKSRAFDYVKNAVYAHDLMHIEHSRPCILAFLWMPLGQLGESSMDVRYTIAEVKVH